MVKTIIRKIKLIGYKNIFIALSKIIYFNFLKQIFRFDKWHSSTPFELRIYKKILVNYINKNIKPQTCVELGCGLGEIISKIKAKCRYGIDISPNVIKAARFLNKKVEFLTGNFDTVLTLPQEIDILIMVNFLHGYKPDEIKQYINKLIKKKQIKYLLMDQLTIITASQYQHDFKRILKGIYEVEDEFSDAGENVRNFVLLKNKNSI
jgi:SAM-dependent methyltransferase